MTPKSIRCPTWLIGSRVYDKVAITLHNHPIDLLIRTSIKMECSGSIELLIPLLPNIELSSIAIE